LPTLDAHPARYRCAWMLFVASWNLLTGPDCNEDDLTHSYPFLRLSLQRLTCAVSVARQDCIWPSWRTLYPPSAKHALYAESMHLFRQCGYVQQPPRWEHTYVSRRDSARKPMMLLFMNIARKLVTPPSAGEVRGSEAA
jgi:hypothetical protein